MKRTKALKSKNQVTVKTAKGAAHCSWLDNKRRAPFSHGQSSEQLTCRDSEIKLYLTSIWTSNYLINKESQPHYEIQKRKQESNRQKIIWYL